jgi:hypothetical protein
MLILSVPETARLAAPVEATVNYEGPPADAAVVSTFYSQVGTLRPSATTDAGRQFAADVQKTIASDLSLQQTQITTYNQIGKTRLLSSTVVARSTSGLQIFSPQPGMVESLRLVNLTPVQPPKLLFVNPVKGIPGDIVSLKATDLVPADRWSSEYVKFHTQVWFTINPNVTVQASIFGVGKDADGATLLQVCVPRQLPP